MFTDVFGSSSRLRAPKDDKRSSIISISEGQRPRHSMTSSDEERRFSYYMSCQDYVYGEPPSLPSPIRKNFRRQDESSCTLSSTKARQSRIPSLEDLANRLIALEQEVYLNRQRTEVNMEEVNNESIWNNINFDEPTKFQKYYSFDEKVLDEGGGLEISSMMMFLMIMKLKRL
uniref:Uncharacterized protein n=1 Tax=Lactuca sativa TaxID=4236 RepID=A0A9R1VMN0_LACSA|nr:hypothetical protein LSAT_V11C500245360 [Lactuca sativa]